MPKRDFQDVLTDLADGEFHRLLTDQMERLVSSVIDTHEKGELTIKLVVVPMKDGKTTDVKATSAIKVPEAKVEVTRMFFGKDGELTLQNPKQTKMRFAEVKTPTSIREARAERQAAKDEAAE